MAAVPTQAGGCRVAPIIDRHVVVATCRVRLDREDREVHMGALGMGLGKQINVYLLVLQSLREDNKRHNKIQYLVDKYLPNKGKTV